MKIAVIVENSSEYGRRLIDGIAAYAQNKSDWRLVWDSPDHFVSSGSLRGCDGVIARIVSDRMAGVLKNSRLPVVDIFCSKDRPGIIGVDSDHEAVGRMAAAHFLSRRYRSLAFAGFSGVRFSDLRLKGFSDALAAEGISPAVLVSGMKNGHRTFFNGRIVDVVDSRQLTRWMKSLPLPAAVFAANDLMALQISLLAEKTGIGIPSDMLLLGVDDDRALCAFAGTPVSSIDPNAYEVGCAAARALDAIVRDRPSKKRHPVYRVKPEGLIERVSTQRHAISPPWLADALGFIDASIGKPLSAADIAEHVGLSYVAVGNMFKRKLGMSPQRYVTTVKMTAARRILEEKPSLLVKEVAARLGFSSVAYFCSAYRRYWGHAPRG